MTYGYLPDAVVGLADLILEWAASWVWRDREAPQVRQARTRSRARALARAATAFLIICCGLAWLSRGLSLLDVGANPAAVAWLERLGLVGLGAVLAIAVGSLRAGYRSLVVRGALIRGGGRESAWRKLRTWWV